MGFIILILPIAALAIWSIFGIHRWLRRGNFGPEWQRAFYVSGLVGLALGIFFAFFMQFRVANVHMEGFPIPAGFSTKATPDAPWQKSDMPQAVRISGKVTDVLSGMALCLLPVAVAAFFKENRGQGPFANPNSPS